MNADELRAEVAYDLENMQRVVDELQALRRDIGSREPTLREQVAAGAFLASFYNGVENILKRISAHNDRPAPEGAKWHVELFDRFTEPPASGLPALFDAALAAAMDPYRRFRHIARAAYGLELDWGKVSIGIDRVVPTFAQFQAAVHHYLDTLP